MELLFCRRQGSWALNVVIRAPHRALQNITTVLPDSLPQYHLLPSVWWNSFQIRHVIASAWTDLSNLCRARAAAEGRAVWLLI